MLCFQCGHLTPSAINVSHNLQCYLQVHWWVNLCRELISNTCHYFGDSLFLISSLPQYSHYLQAWNDFFQVIFWVISQLVRNCDFQQKAFLKKYFSSLLFKYNRIWGYHSLQTQNCIAPNWRDRSSERHTWNREMIHQQRLPNKLQSSW